MKGRLKRLVGSVLMVAPSGFLGLSAIQSSESPILGLLFLVFMIGFSIPSKEDIAWKFWERKNKEDGDLYG